MTNGRIHLFTALGIPVSMHVSWLVVAVLLTWSLATGQFADALPEASSTTRYGLGALGAVGLFLSIVLHELSHSYFAIKAGLTIKGITLFLFGGVAELSDEPKRAKDELVIALAGPAMSLVIAGNAYLLSQVSALGAGLGALFSYLALLNGVLAVFNLVPAFPLDGGRAFRALLWAKHGDFARATRTAARVGVAFAHALIALGLFALVSGDFVSGMWVGLMGFFLKGAAEQAVSTMVTKSALSHVPLRRVMAPGLVTIAPRVTVQELVDESLFRYHFRMLPVVDDDVVLGTIGAEEVSRVPKDEWDTTPVGRVFTPIDEARLIDASATALDTLAKMQAGAQTHLVVVERGRHIVGVVTLRDLLSVLSITEILAREGEAPATRAPFP